MGYWIQIYMYFFVSVFILEIVLFSMSTRNSLALSAPFSNYKTQNKLKKRTNHTNT